MNIKFLGLVCFFFVISTQLFSENKVTFKTDGETLTATIDLNNGESIYLDSSTLYLVIESESYHFIFDGYPDGNTDENGSIFYKDKLTLKGQLILKEGVDKSATNINAIVGFQVINVDGEEGIPIEVAQDLEINSGGYRASSLIAIVSVIIFAVLFLVLLILYIKRRSLE